MIKFAVMTFMYDAWANGPAGSHEELIRMVGESGADGIEAFCNPFMGNPGYLKLYQRELQNAGLKMPVMDLIANLACADKALRAEAYEAMRRGIDVCEALNVEVVHVAGCMLSEGQTPGDGRKWIAEGLTAFVDDVEKRGMILAIEDFDPAPKLICSAADCLEILDRTGGRVKFVFDTGNFEAAGEHAEDNFERLIGRTCHFHFKDFEATQDPSRLFCGAPFGQGRIKNREIAALINKSGYSGWVALESYPQKGNGPRETVAKELRTLKGMFGM